METNIRKGSIDDLPFVQKLAIEMAECSIPPTRRAEPEQLAINLSKIISALKNELIKNPKFQLLIAETSCNQPIGYLILFLNHIDDTTGEAQAFVIDIAVLKKYWGKYVWMHLLKKAEIIAKDNGLKYIAGAVSINNPRMLKTAQKFLGYQIERYQIAKQLS